jgi:hypothetical protein
VTTSSRNGSIVLRMRHGLDTRRVDGLQLVDHRKDRFEFLVHLARRDLVDFDAREVGDAMDVGESRSWLRAPEGEAEQVVVLRRAARDGEGVAPCGRPRTADALKCPAMAKPRQISAEDKVMMLS